MNVREWLRTAKPNYKKVYHVGHLAVDRYEDTPEGRELNTVAHEWMRAAEAGLVQLNQVRGPDGRMIYLATRTEELSE